MPAEALEVISRAAAHAAGRRFYFSGIPCKHGHTAPRYVSTNGCVDCLRKFKTRLNPYSKDLVPFDGAKLWRSRRLSDAQLVQLGEYLQTAADTFCAHVLPPVCKTCDGTHYVPTGTEGQWKLCPDCPDDTVGATVAIGADG